MEKRTQELQHLLVDEEELYAVLGLIGDKTISRVVLTLSKGDSRFTELQRAIGVSSKTLSQRLKLLEKNNLVVKTLYAEVPPRSVYTLSEKGRELLSIFQGILEWESSWENK